MNTLTIIGLFLLAPAIIISIGSSIYEIIKIVKEDIKLGVLLIVIVMSFAGSVLLIISIG